MASASDHCHCCDCKQLREVTIGYSQGHNNLRFGEFIDTSFVFMSVIALGFGIFDTPQFFLLNSALVKNAPFYCEIPGNRNRNREPMCHGEVNPLLFTVIY